RPGRSVTPYPMENVMEQLAPAMPHQTDPSRLSPSERRKWDALQEHARKRPSESREEYANRMNLDGVHKLCIRCGAVRPFGVVRCQCGAYVFEPSARPCTITAGLSP